MTTFTSPAPRQASIAVIGAGPGGLTAARILQRHGLDVTVYDRDEGPDSRDQGGSLDLREDDGQFALAEAGLLERFHELARPEGQEMRQFDPLTGETTFHYRPAAGEQAKPEIDRTQLRTLLVESVRPETIVWNAYVTGVRPSSSGGRTVELADGTTAQHDLVIGADGAFSRVRPQLSSARPDYTGVTFVEAWFNDVGQRHQWLDALCGDGAAAAADGERGMFVQRSSGSHIRVYIMLRKSLESLSAQGLDATHPNGGNTDATRTVLLDEFRDWDPMMRRIITDNDGRFIPRQIWALPVGHRWEHSPSLTLLGDAAHVMPPVGVGVNLAMLDACELALALVHGSSVDDAVDRYEQTMWSRSAEWAELARGGFDDLLDGSPPPIGDDAD